MSRFADFQILPGSMHRDVLGEGPSWSVSDRLLFTIDGYGKRIHWSGLDGSAAGSLEAPSEVGFVIPADDGRLIAGLRDGLYYIDRDEGSFDLLLGADFDAVAHRINDGKVDRAGRLWYGTMHTGETEPSGRLYRYSGGRAVLIRDGAIVSNGLGWSPDSSLMYHTDSGSGTITVSDFDLDTGETANTRLFHRDTAHPSDGLSVDSEGCVWSAKWDAGAVVRFDPDGAEMERISLPASRTTSCAFAGEDFDVLVVTSASHEREEEPLAGSVFLVDVGVAGLPERPFSAW